MPAMTSISKPDQSPGRGMQGRREVHYLDKAVCALEVGRGIQPEACLSHAVPLPLQTPFVEVDMQRVGQGAVLLQSQPTNL